jgi:protein SCO1/2
VEKLNQPVNLDRRFTRSDGREVTLRELMIPGRPAIITPVYYKCSRVCHYTLNGVTKLLKPLGLKLGQDLSIITFTINPEETLELAAKESLKYYDQVETRSEAEKGWHFLVGSEESSSALAAELGFGFKRDGEDYAHAAVLMILTPEGKIARYFYGIDYAEKDVRFALVEASQGRIGNTVDRILLYCFRWDHLTGQYSLAIMNLVQVVSFVVLVGLTTLLVRMRWKEVRGRIYPSHHPG